jgi:hypothetical protein
MTTKPYKPTRRQREYIHLIGNGIVLFDGTLNTYIIDSGPNMGKHLRNDTVNSMRHNGVMMAYGRNHLAGQLFRIKPEYLT